MDDCVLTAKEILIAYVSTLSEDKCRRAYKLIIDELDVDATKFIRFNKNGEQDLTGLVRLKKRQVTMLMKSQGEFKFKWMCNRLHQYLEELSVRATNGDMESKRRLKMYSTSCYDKMVRGWVHEDFLRNNPNPPTHARQKDFFEITTEDEALEYTKEQPIDLALSSPEIAFLASKFKSVNDYVKELNF